jgi:hypothetical protein
MSGTVPCASFAVLPAGAESFEWIPGLGPRSHAAPSKTEQTRGSGAQG